LINSFDKLFLGAIFTLVAALLGVAYLADRIEHRQEMEKLRTVLECKQVIEESDGAL
jgi:hypothetical protein